MKKQKAALFFLFFSLCQAQTSIVINNAIQQNALGINKGILTAFKTLYPSFVVSIEGKELAYNQKTEILLPNNQVTIRYDYDFGWGYNGAKEVTFKLKNKTKDYNIQFISWDHKVKIQLSNAYCIKCKDLYKNKKK